MRDLTPNAKPIKAVDPQTVSALKNLIGNPEFYERESQYDFSEERNLFELLSLLQNFPHKEAAHLGISLTDKIEQSRPITVYFDAVRKFATKNRPAEYCLESDNITARMRYGGKVFKSGVGFKADISHLGVPCLMETFSQAATSITRRAEVENHIHLQKFKPSVESLLPYGAAPDKAIDYLRRLANHSLDGNSLESLFLTDSKRTYAIFQVALPQNKVAAFEISIDACRYFELAKNAKIWVPASAKQSEHDKAIVHDKSLLESKGISRCLKHPDDIFNAKINGNFLGFKPQFELEFYNKASTPNLTDDEIVCAEIKVTEFLRAVLGKQAFHPKPTKAKVGYGLLKNAA